MLGVEQIVRTTFEKACYFQGAAKRRIQVHVCCPRIRGTDKAEFDYFLKVNHRNADACYKVTDKFYVKRLPLLM